MVGASVMDIDTLYISGVVMFTIGFIAGMYLGKALAGDEAGRDD